MPAYDSKLFDPPAPVALVVLRDPRTGAVWENVPMLLDSGADVSLVPREVLTRLRVEPEPERRYRLLGFGDKVTYSEVVLLELSLLGRVFRGLFLLNDEPGGILGRNVLNSVCLTLDGPSLTWGIRTKPQDNE